VQNAIGAPSGCVPNIRATAIEFKDFALIANRYNIETMLTVHPAVAASTLTEFIQKVLADMAKVLAIPDMRETLASQRAEPAYLSSRELTQLIKDDAAPDIVVRTNRSCNDSAHRHFEP